MITKTNHTTKSNKNIAVNTIQFSGKIAEKMIEVPMSNVSRTKGNTCFKSFFAITTAPLFYPVFIRYTSKITE